MNHQLAVIDVVLRLGIEGDKVILGLTLAGHHADIVTAHQRIQAALSHIFNRDGANMFFAEFWKTRRPQEGAAAVDHVGNAVAVELNHTIFIQAEVTVIDSKNFQTFR